MVSVVIHSEPPGADVLIAGAKIGTTPFESKLKRGTKIAGLTVQKDGYAPFNTKIDLGGEYENRNIKLIRLEDMQNGSDGSTATDKGATDKGATDKGATGSDATDASDKGTSKTTTKTGTGDKTTSTDKTTGTTPRTTQKTGTGAKSTTTTPKADKTDKTEKTEKIEKKEEKCQPPGPNVDPFGPPICKT